MSGTVLGGDFTVYYLSETRQKRVVYTGSGSTYSVNELYSALQDHFDELTQLDDGVPMSAQTPTEYTIGIIDSGDNDPWFIDPTSCEYLYGGALKTNGWTRSEGSNVGIVRVPYTQSTIVAGDVGNTISGATDGNGTLIYWTDSYLWIRPDSDVAGDSFSSTAQNLTCNGHTDSQNGDQETGDLLWANIYSIGTIESDTHLYIEQDGSNLTADKASTDWWSDGHIDILVQVREMGTAGYTEIDDGVLRVLARKYTAAYDYFELDLTSGGRNPIPLATSADLDNTTGLRQMAGLSISGGPFVVGEIIEDDTDSTIQGIVTNVSGNDIQYILIGDPLTDFASGTGGFTGADSGATATAVNPTDVGPADIANWGSGGLAPVITHGGTTADIDEDGSSEPYSVTIDVNQNTLAELWEWLKYITRRGETGTGNTDGQEGQFYVGNEYQVEYTAQAGGAWTEGSVVYLIDTDNSSGLGANSTIATGTIVADHDDGAAGDLLLRNVRSYASLSHVDAVWDAASGATVTATYDSANSRVITPTKQSPFGTFAGGTFFGAEGVLLSDYRTTEANNFQLKDDDGTVRTVPIKVSVQVTNTRAGDSIAVFSLDANGDIQKDDYFAAVASQHATSLAVTSNAETAIAVDAPGKTGGGVLRVVDVSATPNVEYRIRFGSWASTTFKLAGHADHDNSNGLTSTATSTTTRLYVAGALGFVQIGDLIYNATAGAYGYVTDISGAPNYVDHTPIAGQSASGDTIHINCLPIATTTSDLVYVPFIDIYEDTGSDGTPGSEGITVVYSSSRDVRVRARQAGVIIPFEADNAIGSGGMSQAVIRTADTIYS